MTNIINRLLIEHLQQVFHLIVDTLSKVFHLHLSLLATALLTHGHEAVGCFLLTHNKHVRHTLELVVTDLPADLLVTVIDVSADIL